jgi:hypothetical protein
LKPEQWGSLLVQENNQEEKVCDKRRIIIIIIIGLITLLSFSAGKSSPIPDCQLD